MILQLPRFLGHQTLNAFTIVCWHRCRSTFIATSFAIFMKRLGGFRTKGGEFAASVGQTFRSFCVSKTRHTIKPIPFSIRSFLSRLFVAQTTMENRRRCLFQTFELFLIFAQSRRPLFWTCCILGLGFRFRFCFCDDGFQIGCGFVSPIHARFRSKRIEIGR